MPSNEYYMYRSLSIILVDREVKTACYTFPLSQERKVDRDNV